ncbi:MAG TPA: type II secretion system F family protein [Verrucomicrobiae bacterium]|nr:type II secretion system F family protein [Verrucomicrobiae bacterium]
MTVMFTPGQFTQRAEFYHQLGQLTSAGLTLPVSLEQLRRSPPGPSYRAPIEAVLHQLSAGCSFTEALRQQGSWLPAFDMSLLFAGEHSGRLDSCFKLLADYYQERARTLRQLLTDLAYPLFLLHFGILIFTFIQLLHSNSWVAPLVQPACLLVALYGGTFLVIYATQSRHGETWRGRMEALLRPVPVLGTARRELALARLSAALEALLNAGVSIIEAWELAAAASGSPALRRTVLSWRPQLESGETPAEVLRRSGKFPEMFANQYATGEISGKLDETLGRLHQYYQDVGSRKVHIVSQWVPRFIYLIVMLLVAYKVVSFYLGYFRDVSNAGGF